MEMGMGTAMGMRMGWVIGSPQEEPSTAKTQTLMAMQRGWRQAPM